MGLDTTHDCWHGAYSSFSRFRDEVAKAAGYEIWKVEQSEGFTRDTIIIDWGHITEENLFGKWDETPADPLIVLIAHSDCEGSIYPAQAAPLADRLEELLPKIAELGEGTGHIAGRGGWAEVTKKFINGLRVAAASGEPVEFH
jgi:hypothetical protein